MFPQHNVYGEAFLGDGSVFFEKEPSEVEVLADSPSSFFFIDPPEMGFDFEAFADWLGQLEGKFLMTINDSPYIRKTFKGFKQYRYSEKGALITNYDLPRNWRSRMTKGALSGGKYVSHKDNVLDELGLDGDGYSLEELAEASGVEVLQQVYNRGIGAHPTSVRMKGSVAPLSKKLSKEQWAMSRVYSFLDGNPKHDQDLRDPYLTEVRRRAKANGYDPRAVSYAKDGKHKIAYTTPSGRTVKFGREGYGDHILWSMCEKDGKVPIGTASSKRRVFQASHSAIRGKWREDQFSPNMLALKLLW